MKASDLIKSLMELGLSEDDAKAQAKDAIAKGSCADDLGLMKATASKAVADLIAKGMDKDKAEAMVKGLVAAGKLTDDAASVEGDALLKAAQAATADLQKAAEALAAAGDAPPPATDPDPDATEGQLFKGAAERVAETADVILKAQGAGYQALVKAQLAQVDGYQALIKSNVATQASLAAVNDKLDLVFKALNVEMPPRARTGAEAEPHPGERRPAGDAASKLAKGAKLDALIQKTIAENPARAHELRVTAWELSNGGDPDTLAAAAGLSL